LTLPLALIQWPYQGSYVKTTICLLIAAAVIAGMAGCASVPCDLTVASTAGGSVAAPVNGTSAYYHGEIVSLVANPEAGYRFLNWSGDVDTVADVTAASTTVIMNGSHSITANFEELPPLQDSTSTPSSLDISSTSGGWVTQPGGGSFTYDAGTVVSLLATPADGYRFVNWTGEVGSVANVDSAATTITMDGSYSITAKFEELPPVQHSLSISSTAGGSVTVPGEGTFSCDEGETVDLVATPDEGYLFAGWTGDADTIANVDSAATTITMNGDCSIVANFEPIPPVRYSLTIASSAGGSVTIPGQGTFTYDAGTVVSLAALSANGYRFVSWTGTVDNVGDVNAALTTITMNGNCSILANFEQTAPAWYYLAISSTAGGSVTTPGQGTYVCSAGAVVSLVATPATGYQFVSWTGDVGTIANANSASTTITMTGHYSIKANFESTTPGQFELATSSTAGGSVAAPGEGTFTYDPGSVIGLTAMPDSGYHFVNWTGDVGTIANVNSATTTITVNGNYSVRANFAADSSSPPEIGYTEAEAEALIIVLVNNERSQFGLATLSEDALLASLAREHSISMVVNGFFGHERYPGERSFSYGQPPGTIRGENIAMIPTRRTIPGPYLSLQEVCEWAVSLWMGSAGHRANILEPRYNKTGVGVAFSQDGNYLYITQMFEGPL
jgi:uncharacterized repeat protein (TIGR02543 family)